MFAAVASAAEEADVNLLVITGGILDSHEIPFQPELVYDGDFTQASGVAGAKWLLSRDQKFDALVGAVDLMVLAAMETLREQGVRVPQDVSVVGFDNIEESRFASPQLTTVRQPFPALGREAVRLAMLLLENRSVPHRVELESEMVIRSSCGCPARCGESKAVEPETSVPPSSSLMDVAQRAKARVSALKDTELVIDEDTWLRVCSLCFADWNVDPNRISQGVGLRSFFAQESKISLHGIACLKALCAGRCSGRYQATRPYEALAEGDILLLYTDGATEARDVNGRLFGAGRLKEELAGLHRLPVSTICSQLLGKIKSFMFLQHDDTSLLVARYGKPSKDSSLQS